MVGAWRRVQYVPDNCRVLLGRKKRRFNKGGVDSFGGEHRDEGAKTMEM